MTEQSLDMGVVSLSRKDAVARRRCAILESARGVFARLGYADTGVEDIAAQAGIAKGTLYLYFPSKEQVYLAALMDDARQLDCVSRAAMAAGKTWQEKLRAFVEVRLNYFDQHQDFLRIFLTEFRSMHLQGKPVQAELHHFIQQEEAQVAQMLATAAARGEIRELDAELAALTVTDLTHGLMERRLRNWGRPAGPADTEFALDILCRALAPA
jgi:AcrR family transcriptional regulator